jgi:2-keto-3-deoxy-L-rhamnonate aldolase RhmA
MRNRVKAMIREGKTAVGIWVSIGHPDVTEILSRVGFDFFMLDLEHGPLSIETTQTLMMAMNGLSSHRPMMRRSRSALASESEAWAALRIRSSP